MRSAELEAHAAGCAACTARLRRAEGLRSAVRESVPYYRASPELKERVLTKVAPPRKWGGWIWAPLLSAAAIIGLFAVVTPRLGTRTLERELVASHVRSL